jgi:hypothetical protein
VGVVSQAVIRSLVRQYGVEDECQLAQTVLQAIGQRLGGQFSYSSLGTVEFGQNLLFGQLLVVEGESSGSQNLIKESIPRLASRHGLLREDLFFRFAQDMGFPQSFDFKIVPIGIELGALEELLD